MNNPNNLLNMMQTGGQASSAGGAAFARALQRRSDTKKLERQQRREARRQKKGRLFGSIAGLAGQGLGFLVGGSAGAAAGKALGTGLGQSLGAGKAQKYSRAGTVFNQDAFRDVSDASSDYNKGILGRSLLAGGESLAASYLSPGGFKGAPTKALPTASQYALPNASDAALKAGRQMGSEGAGLVFGRGGMDAIYGGQGGFNLPKPPSLLNYTTDNSIYSGGISSFNPFQNFDDGGLINYMHGGVAHDDDSYSAAGILGQQGLDPTEEQLKLFQSFDPTQIQQAKTGAEQSLMSMTGGMGLSSTGGGFGAKQRAATSAIGAGQDLVGDTTEQAQKSFESQTLGTAADLVAGGAEFREQYTPEDPVYGQFDKPPTEDAGWNPPAGAGAGTPYDFNGVRYIFDAPNWVTEEQYQSDMDDYYDTYG